MTSQPSGAFFGCHPSHTTAKCRKPLHNGYLTVVNLRSCFVKVRKRSSALHESRSGIDKTLHLGRIRVPMPAARGAGLGLGLKLHFFQGTTVKNDLVNGKMPGNASNAPWACCYVWAFFIHAHTPACSSTKQKHT